MTTKPELTDGEWQLLRDAPFWVFAALTAADGRSSMMNRRREAVALDAILDDYKADNPLIQVALDAADDDHEVDKNAAVADAELRMAQINQILMHKVEREQGEAYRDFLMAVGQAIASAAKEGMGRKTEEVSEEEKAALDQLAAALQARPADKRKRQLEERQEEREAAAARQAEVRARAQRETDARQRRAELAAERAAAKEAKAAAVAQAAAAQAAAAKAANDQAAKAKAAAQQAAEEKAARSAEMREKVEQLAEQRRAEAKAKEMRDRVAKLQQTAQDKAAAAKETVVETASDVKDTVQETVQSTAQAVAQVVSSEPEPIAEHTVVSGDTLSGIALRYYGSAARAKWMAIYEANKETIGNNPNLIRIGQKLTIPALD